MNKLLLFFILFSSVCFADPKYSKDTYVKFISQDYGQCYGFTSDVSAQNKSYLYRVKIDSCVSGYGSFSTVDVMERNLELGNHK